jgi:Domain of unknown function (DUF4349)
MRRIMPILLISLICFVGCSTSRKSAPLKDAGNKGEPEFAMEAPKVDIARPEADQVQVAAGQIGQPPEKKLPADDKAKAKGEKPRKIRYTANLNLIVDDLDKSAESLDEARKEAKGEYAKVEINTSPQTVRTGMWRVRVPVDSLHTFRKAVAKLGEVTSNTIDTDDMTAQYYDLMADIENRKAAREALRDLLKETGKKEMKHYLEVWDKLESVSNEINRKEGQLKLWADLTDLTTVTVTLREKQKYIVDKGPEPAEVPTFGMRAGKTWSESWEALLAFGEALAIVAIAVTPWLPLILVVGVTGWLIVRRVVRATVAVMAAAEAKK